MKALLLVLLAACGARETYPAWPNPHPKWDGGESIAPRYMNPITVAAEIDVEEEPIVEAPPPPVVAKPVEIVKPVAPVVKPASPEEPLNLEETIIEIDD